jgi:hypothetical protein
MATDRHGDDVDLDQLTEEELMALAAGGSADMAAGLLRGADGTIEKSAEVQESERRLAQYVQERQALEEALAAGARELDDVDPAAAEEGAEEQAEEEEEDEEGMGQPCGTVESTWGGEASDWVLEKIVRRRKNSGGGRIASADLGDADDEDVAWEYCCVWRGYAEPTWERRGFLRDLGYGPEVAAYDAEHKAHYRKTSRLRPQKPARRLLGTKDDAVQERARLRKQQEAARKASDFVCQASAAVDRQPYAAMLCSSLPSSYSSERVLSLCKDVRNGAGAALVMRVLQDLAACNVLATSMEFICPKVVDTVLDNAAGRACTLVYHGTGTNRAAKAIAKVGLVIPGEGNSVKVANGTAHGVGIYTADTPSTPCGYARQGDLFACVGVTGAGPTLVMAASAGWFIFRRRELVAPFLHIRISKDTVYSPTPTVNFAVDADGQISNFIAPRII